MHWGNIVPLGPALCPTGANNTGQIPGQRATVLDGQKKTRKLSWGVVGTAGIPVAGDVSLLVVEVLEGPLDKPLGKAGKRDAKVVELEKVDGTHDGGVDKTP